MDVYFPTSGVISPVVRSPEGLEVEGGLVGRDGFVPTAPVSGAETTAYRVQVQLAGAFWKIATAPFLAAQEARPGFRRLLTLFIETLIVQTSNTALSNAVHQIDERLARWILMVDDRCDSNEFALTQEFVPLMLAVRRPSVTTALHVLEGKGLIHAEQGRVTVRNRAALEQIAGDSYGAAEKAYRTLIGEMPPLPS